MRVRPRLARAGKLFRSPACGWSTFAVYVANCCAMTMLMRWLLG